MPARSSESGNFPVRCHVDFGTVARRKNQEFVKRRMAERFRLHIHRDVELFADCDFGHLVAHACHVDFAHGPKIEKEARLFAGSQAADGIEYEITRRTGYALVL